MRSHLLTMITSVALTAPVGLTACGDDTSTPDTSSGDTIVDSNQPVDSADSTNTNDDSATTPADSTAPSDSATTTTPPADTTQETDTGPAPIVVTVNEVSADEDWIELYNAGTSTADIGGWSMRDSNDDPETEFVIPAGTTLEVGEHRIFGQDSGGVVGFVFGLGDQDSITLYDRDGVFKQGTTWVPGDAPTGGTWGRIPDGTGPFKTLFQPTKGAANLDNPPAACGNDILELGELCDGAQVAEGVDCTDWGWGGGTLGCAGCSAYVFDQCTPRTGGLVINEVTSSDPDRIEIYNGAPALIALNGYYIKDDAGNMWPFPSGNIPAGGYKVLTKDLVGEFTFGIGSNDAITLYDKNNNVVDQADWLDDEAEVSYCRSPNGVGGFKSCATATFGTANP